MPLSNEQVTAIQDKVAKLVADKGVADKKTADANAADTAVAQAEAAKAQATAVQSQAKLDEAAAGAVVNSDLKDLERYLEALLSPPTPPA